MNKETFKVKPVQLDQTIKNIVDAIDKGYELQGFEELSTTEEQRLDYSDSLILKPDYQREYRATLEDESSLIESILVGIPIPPVFLSIILNIAPFPFFYTCAVSLSRRSGLS